MKIITTVQQLLFSKTTDLYTLEKKIWEDILSSMKAKKDMQTNKISSTQDKKRNFHFARNYSKCL